MQRALTLVRAQGGEIIHGGRTLSGADYPGGCYVEPTLVKARADMAIVKEENLRAYFVHHPVRHAGRSNCHSK